MKIKLGDLVRQTLPAPIEGQVIQKQFVQETDEFQYLVEWPAPDGSPHSKWFNAGEIEVKGDAK